jgi:hypothetical protein
MVLVALRLQCFVLAPYCYYGCRVGVGDIYTGMAMVLTRRACWTNAIASASSSHQYRQPMSESWQILVAHTWSFSHGICCLSSRTVLQPMSQVQKMAVWKLTGNCYLRTPSVLWGGRICGRGIIHDISGESWNE